MPKRNVSHFADGSLIVLFLQELFLQFDLNFYGICSERSDRQQVYIGSSYGLEPISLHAII